MLSWLYIRQNPYVVKGRGYNSKENKSYRGTLQVDGSELVFEGLAARVAFPLSDLRLSRDRWLGGAIQFKHPDSPDWTLYTRNVGILNDPAFQNDADLIELARQGLVYFHSLRRWLRWTCLATLLLFIFVAPVRNFLTAQTLRLISVELEITLGERFFKATKPSLTFIEDAQTVEDLKGITDRLLMGVPSEDHRFHFRYHIVRDARVNAYALPGGHIIVFTGLLLDVESAQELAGILGHETAHVTCRHSMGGLVQIVGTYALMWALFAPDSEVALPLDLAALRYSRDHELEADREGCLYLQHASIDPHGLLEFFERLGAQEKETDLDPLVGMTLTHPPSRERAERLRQVIAQDPATYRRLPVDFQKFKERIRQLTADKTASPVK